MQRIQLLNGVQLNGVQTTPSFYSALPGSPLRTRTVASAAGAVITFDCDYAPTKDTVRTRRPQVSEGHISEVKVDDVVKDGVKASCYQAFVLLGPVPASFNGSPAHAEIFPIRNVTISDCDFAHPANVANPYSTPISCSMHRSPNSKMYALVSRS